MLVSLRHHDKYYIEHLYIRFSKKVRLENIDIVSAKQLFSFNV